MLEGLKERIHNYWQSEEVEELPADFSFIDEGSEESYLSYRFVTEIDYPHGDSLLLDENVIYDHLEDKTRFVEAYLDDSEVASLMAVLGYEPERKNITRSGQYRYVEEVTGEDIEEMLELAHQQDIDMYYVSQVEDILLDNGFEDETVRRYMEELDKIAEPVDIEPITENTMMDSAIALKAEQENMNIVTSDADFVERPHLGMEVIDNSVFTPQQVKQLLQWQKELEKRE